MIPIACITICVLSMILATLYIEEYRHRAHHRPRGLLQSRWHGEERRQEQRFDCELEVAYSTTTARNEKHLSMSANISTGGICLRLPEKLPLNSSITMELVFSPRQRINAIRGKILWVRDGLFDEKGRRYFLTGVQFIDPTPTIDEHLAAVTTTV